MLRKSAAHKLHEISNDQYLATVSLSRVHINNVILLHSAGCYEHGVPKNRHIQWHQSFGGAPIKLPDVHIKSTIGTNTAKLLSTRDAKKHHRRLAYLKLYWE